MWNRGWGELQFAEVGGQQTTSVPGREGKGDKGCVEAFWDGVVDKMIPFCKVEIYYSSLGRCLG